MARKKYRKTRRAPRRVGSRRYRRRFSTRRRTRGGRISRWRLRGTLLPDAIFVKLRYTEDYRLGSVTSSTNTTFNSYRGNSGYDPDVALSAQPSAAGWGYYTQNYQRYVVMGSSIRVNYVNRSPAERVVGLYPGETTDSVAATTTLNTLVGTPYVRWTTLAPAGVTASCKTLKMYMSTKKLLAQPNVTTAPQFSADPSSNPTLQWYWRVWLHQPTIDDTNNLDVDYQVTMTYYVKFFQRTLYTGNNT